MSVVRLPTSHLVAKGLCNQALELEGKPLLRQAASAQMQERRIARSQDEIHCLTLADIGSSAACFPHSALLLEAELARTQPAWAPSSGRLWGPRSAVPSSRQKPSVCQETAEEKLRLLEVVTETCLVLHVLLSLKGIPLAHRPTAKDSNWRTSDSSASCQQDLYFYAARAARRARPQTFALLHEDRQS